MKEIGSLLHISHISEMLSKYLNTFASQSKELCLTPPMPICDCSCPHGHWELFSRASRLTGFRNTFHFAK